MTENVKRPLWNVAFWLRLSKKSRGSEFLKQRFKNRGDIESMLLQVQLTGTKVAQNRSAPTSSTASATSRLPVARNRLPLHPLFCCETRFTVKPRNIDSSPCPSRQERVTASVVSILLLRFNTCKIVLQQNRGRSGSRFRAAGSPLVAEGVEQVPRVRFFETMIQKPGRC